MRWRRPVRTLLAIVGGCVALAIVIPPIAGVLDAGASLALLGTVGVAVVRGVIWVDRLGRAARRVAASRVRPAVPTGRAAPAREAPPRPAAEPAPPVRAGPARRPPAASRRPTPARRVEPPAPRDDERAARWPAIAISLGAPAARTRDGGGGPRRA